MAALLKSLKLLADPTRLRLLHVLSEEGLSVADLQEVLAMGQSRISSQLSQLRTAGLVQVERSGRNNIYRASLNEQMAKLADTAVSELADAAKDQHRLTHLLKKRQDKTRAYFDKLAGKFGRSYVPGRSWKGLAEALLKVMAHGVVADLGAGEGTLSQLLAQRAKKVIAIDLSPKMVEYGAKIAKENGLKNLEYRLGDLESPPLKPGSVDLIVLSQALHHATHPLRALKASCSALKPGGQIIILDLLAHNFEEARELYTHQWLGFSEAELDSMLEKAGFSRIETAVVDREDHPPYFQTLVATAQRPVSRKKK